MQTFINGDYENGLWEYKRSLVSDGLQSKLEYIYGYLAEFHFTEIIEGYLSVKKFLQNYLFGFDIDLKSSNPNMGKKKVFKKS